MGLALIFNRLGHLMMALFPFLDLQVMATVTYPKLNLTFNFKLIFPAIILSPSHLILPQYAHLEPFTKWWLKFPLIQMECLGWRPLGGPQLPSGPRQVVLL